MSNQDYFLEPIDSIIGEKAQFNGDFILQGTLRIDGVLSGKIVSEGKVIIGPRGHVKTNIIARTVIVAGRVDGNIYALESVHLLEDARLYGDIITSNMIMQDGVIFEGRAKINKIDNEKAFFEASR
ncbi:MAG: polymer-forming cytoskeletal protein [Spirochaetia bacterium]|nr:polymer-forming cytoskeletal protein [Spirochaetia bacterium]